MYQAIDMHCDTVSCLWKLRQNGAPEKLRSCGLSVDLEKLKQGNYLLQNFAMFVMLRDTSDPLQSVLELIDEYYRQMEENKDLIAPVYSIGDIERNRNAGLLSALLTVEEGGVCKGSLEVLRVLYRLGVRMMTLTWNFENELGYPGTNMKNRPVSPMGLKPRGIEFVREMNRLGMIVDVSHLGDGGFWDVAEYCKGPFVASHSNARAVCGHGRNLTDDMIRTLADHGGVMGINFCADFLREKNGGTIDDMIRHMKHIRNVGGIGVLGLGSDFDGIENTPEVEHAGMMPALALAMERAGFTGRDIEAVFCENVLRVYREILK
ncbi:MAG: dipeptidase [Oscillospiraceae bacterium]|nr:dipeptidase [Oscillospiraceae bacterium]